MIVRAEHVNCRRNIINGIGQWTVDEMCDSCKIELFTILMVQAECGNIPHSKDIIVRTLDRMLEKK